MATIILVDAGPRRLSDGVVVPVTLAGGGNGVPYPAGYRAGIRALPSITAALDFADQEMGGGGVPQAAGVDFAPARSSVLADTAGLYWPDAAITVRIGPEGAGTPPIVIAGTVLEAPVTGGVLQIALADPAAGLKRPVVVDRFAGTGGLEGPAELTGVAKARAWGRCFNVFGQPLDPANNILCFGDPGRRWQSFDTVRDRGALADADDLTFLAWQGSAAATLAALQAAAPIAGGGVLAPDIACIKWWTDTTGLTADIRGEIAGGYVETASEIAARIVAARSALTCAAGTVAAAKAARPAVFGWRVENDSTTVADVLSAILGDVSTSWLLDAGQIVLRPWEWNVPTVRVQSFAVKRRETLRPVATRKIGYQRNWHPVSRGDLAEAVLTQDFTYADGTPFEDLKPAQPGADVTGDNTSKDTLAVADRDAAELVESVDVNTSAILSESQRQDDLLLVFDARTLVEGQPVGPRLLSFKNTQEGINAGVASSLDLLGYKTTNGAGWVLDLQKVKVDALGKTLAQKLEEVGATDGDIAATVTALKEAVIDPTTGGLAKFVINAEVDGGTVYIAGISGTASETSSDLNFVAENFRFVRPNGGSPLKLLIYNGTLNRWEFTADVFAKRIVAGAIDFEFEGDRQQLDPSGWYQKLPGGMIMQGGQYRATILGETTFGVTFPLQFPNQVLSYGAMPYNASGSNLRDLWMQNRSSSTSGASFVTQSSTGNSQQIDGFDWWAWGE